MKKIICFLLSTSLLGCVASQESINTLNYVKGECAAGNGGACNAIPSAQAQVDQEKAESGRGVAAAIVLGLLAGAAAVNESRQPTYLLVRRCRWC